MSATPSASEQRFTAAVSSWRSLKPLKKFLGLTPDGFEAELKPCFDVRAEIADLETKLAGARTRRNELDAQGLDLVDRLVSAVKSDATEGEDSELLESMGYVIKSKRKSGLHRKAPQPLAKAA